MSQQIATAVGTVAQIDFKAGVVSTGFFISGAEKNFAGLGGFDFCFLTSGYIINGNIFIPGGILCTGRHPGGLAAELAAGHQESAVVGSVVLEIGSQLFQIA